MRKAIIVEYKCPYCRKVFENKDEAEHCRDSHPLPVKFMGSIQGYFTYVLYDNDKVVLHRGPQVNLEEYHYPDAELFAHAIIPLAEFEQGKRVI